MLIVRVAVIGHGSANPAASGCVLRNAFKTVAAVGADSDVVGHWQVGRKINSRPAFGEGLVVARDMIAGVALGTDKRERATMF
jgi:hypothetical protein